MDTISALKLATRNRQLITHYSLQFHVSISSGLTQISGSSSCGLGIYFSDVCPIQMSVISSCGRGLLVIYCDIATVMLWKSETASWDQLCSIVSTNRLSQKCSVFLRSHDASSMPSEYITSISPTWKSIFRSIIWSFTDCFIPSATPPDRITSTFHVDRRKIRRFSWPAPAIYISFFWSFHRSIRSVIIHGGLNSWCEYVVCLDKYLSSIFYHAREAHYKRVSHCHNKTGCYSVARYITEVYIVILSLCDYVVTIPSYLCDRLWVRHNLKMVNSCIFLFHHVLLHFRSNFNLRAQDLSLTNICLHMMHGFDRSCYEATYLLNNRVLLLCIKYEGFTRLILLYRLDKVL